MTNLFLKVNKDLFNLGLNPTEILVLAQVMEYETNTGDFFMSNEALAKNFGVSESTINRTIKALENKKFINRTTKNVKGGKERHITVNKIEIQQQLTSVNLEVVDNDENDLQTSNCTLTSVNLNIDNKQNDTIKDKLIDNQKEKLNDKPREDGSIEHPYLMPKAKLARMANELQQLSNGLFMDNNRVFYKMMEV